MPSLKDISCSIELARSREKLSEYGTIYGDGFVETFVAVPDEPVPFAVHLKSNAYIAQGLAMYVFIDGVYQCNRNRYNLVEPTLVGRLGHHSLVDFSVRQKEERRGDGSMVAREWTFEKLNTVSADDETSTKNPNVLQGIGCIEVLVVRCTDPRDAQPFRQQPAEERATVRVQMPPRFAFGFDGAGDLPTLMFGLDGSGRDWTNSSDSRNPYEPDRDASNRHSGRRERGRHGGGYEAPVQRYAYVRPVNAGYRMPPPPYIEYESTHGRPSLTYGEPRHHVRLVEAPSVTHQGRSQSRRHHDHDHSGRGYDLPQGPPEYHHVPGSVRSGPRAETDEELYHQRTPDKISSELPDWMNDVLAQMTAEAYRRGQEAQMQQDREQSRQQHHEMAQLRSGFEAHQLPYNAQPHLHLPASQAVPLTILGVENSGWTSHPSIPSLSRSKSDDMPLYPRVSKRGRRSRTGAKNSMSDGISTEATWGSKDNYGSRRANARQEEPDIPGSWNDHGWSTAHRSPSPERGRRLRRPEAHNQDKQRKESRASSWGLSDATVTPKRQSQKTRGEQASSPDGRKSTEDTSPRGNYAWRASSRGKKHRSTGSWGAASTSAHSSPFEDLPPAFGPDIEGLERALKKASLSSNNSHGEGGREHDWDWIGGRSSSKCPERPQKNNKWGWGSDESDKADSWGLGETTRGGQKKEVMPGTWSSDEEEGAQVDKPDDKEATGPNGKINDNGWGGNSWGGYSWDDAEKEKDITSNDKAAEEKGNSSNNADSGWSTGAWNTAEANTTDENGDANEMNDKNDGAVGPQNSSNVQDQGDQSNAWNMDGPKDNWNTSNNDTSNQVGDDSGDKQDSYNPFDGSGWGNKNSNNASGADNNGDASNNGNSWHWNNGNTNWANNWEADDVLGGENGVNGMFGENNDTGGGAWGDGGNGFARQTPGDNFDTHNAEVKRSTASNASRKKAIKNYHRARHASANATPQAHWNFPPSPPKDFVRIPEDYESVDEGGKHKVFTVPEEPLYAIPERKAKKEFLDHQVRVGKGVEYHHDIGRPRYIDNLDKPYAIFRFKYRSLDKLQVLFPDEFAGMSDLLDDDDKTIKDGFVSGWVEEQARSQKARSKTAESKKGSSTKVQSKKASSQAGRDGWSAGWGAGGHDGKQSSKAASNAGGTGWAPVDDQKDNEKKSTKGEKQATNAGGGSGWGIGWHSNTAKDDASKKSEKAASDNGEPSGLGGIMWGGEGGASGEAGAVHVGW